MKSSARRVGTVVAALALLVTAAVLKYHRGVGRSEDTGSAGTTASVGTLQPTATLAPVSAPAASNPLVADAPAPLAERYPDEASLMQALRPLDLKNPELALQLAREGERRFAGSADAPERAWILVRALTHLNRFDEARAEARVFVDKYRGTGWMSDLKRHVLTNPPGGRNDAPVRNPER